MIRQFVSTEKHSGHYVAFRSRDDESIVASGPDPKDVFDRAKQQGVEKPVIAFIPETNAILIY